MSQYADAREYVVKSGTGKGTTVIEVRTGGGLSFCIVPDRGMDILQAEYKGIPVAYTTRNGLLPPWLLKESGADSFHRNFFAGLLTTCGLENVGPYVRTEEEEIPAHGRFNLTPAETYQVKRYRQEGDDWIGVTGSVRQTRMFGGNLILEREIRVRIGDNRIWLRDRLTNDDAEPARYMLMYHVNFGFPLVSPHSKAITNHEKRRLFAQNQWTRNKPLTFSAPQKSFEEQVYFLEGLREDQVFAAVVNRELGLGAYMEVDRRQLPCFTQWVNLKEQEYVLGLEPGKQNPIGRQQAEREGKMTEIRPGETQETELVLGMITPHSEHAALLFAEESGQ